MRTLVIAADYPWPQNSGSRLRLAGTLRGLRACGPVELFSIVPTHRSDLAAPPAAAGVARVGHVTIDDATSLPRFVRSVARVGLPFEIPVHNRPAVRAALERFRTGHYELIWCFRVRAWVLAGEPEFAPVVVDLDDLEDQKILARLASPPDTERSTAGRVRVGGARLRAVAGRALWTNEVGRWRVLHRRISRAAAAVVVCSQLDADRVGVPGVRVLPNGYPDPSHPAGHVTPTSPPTVLFHGTLRYPPNADAARFLVEEVAPRLRTLVPETRVRLVGRAPSWLEALADPPRVTLVGQVPDITTELARADVVIVPLRYASGTRVKIVEAFAHRVPVVSTTIGAEGLGVVDGTHVLLADDATSLAEACARLLTDPTERARLVDRAHALYLDRFESAVVDAQVGRIVEEVVAP
jgi:glycosyltransferase involved in cell wall biosynthesis